MARITRCASSPPTGATPAAPSAFTRRMRHEHVDRTPETETARPSRTLHPLEIAAMALTITASDST
ncbi:hypothetical protein MXC99_00310, partial [Thauera aromatica]|uniref:hypothetical protein n=1 Tax=Thauera aromatica TaxID=59405 RepID=UPI001FFC8109